MPLDVPTIVLALGALVFVAHFFEWLFSLTKVPNVLLLIIVGLALGPISGLLTPEFFGDAGQVGIIIALIIILFEGGTELRLDSLAQAWKGTLRLTFLSFFVTMGVVGLFVWWLTPLSLILSLAIGSMIGGTAAVVVIPIIEGLKMHESSKTTLFLESAVSDVLAVVITIGLLQAIQAGDFAAASLVLRTISSLVIPAAIGLVAGLLWSLLLNKVRHMSNSIFTTPAFVFILFGAVEFMGLSGLIAALVFGVTMGNVSR